MQYFISFLEGIITFISPCLLPMLPIYISYFAGGNPEEDTKKTISNALGFILGFSLVFILLGGFAGMIGGFLSRYQATVNIITGAIVILFGLNFMEIIHINFLNQAKGLNIEKKDLSFWSATLFGIVFSIGWTPCVGAFLGSALMLASQQGSALKGILMLICYSLGLGVPFLISAVLINKLKGTFNFIKKHYKIVNKICGLFLIIIGILMMTGLMGYFLSLLS